MAVHLSKTCPAALALGLIANKWSIAILACLLEAPAHTLRFNRLKTALAPITQRELTRQLREFEASGIITRTVHATVPPQVSYTLTPLGHALWTPIGQLSAWAETHGPAIQQHRQRHQARAARRATVPAGHTAALAKPVSAA